MSVSCSPFHNNNYVSYSNLWFTIHLVLNNLSDPEPCPYQHNNLHWSQFHNGIHDTDIPHPLLVGLLPNANPDNNNPRPSLECTPTPATALPTFDLHGMLWEDKTESQYRIVLLRISFWVVLSMSASTGLENVEVGEKEKRLGISVTTALKRCATSISLVHLTVTSAWLLTSSYWPFFIAS